MGESRRPFVQSTNFPNYWQIDVFGDRLQNVSLTSKKGDSLVPKLRARAFMGLCMQVVVCLCAQVTSGNPLVWHFIEYQSKTSPSRICNLLWNTNLNLNISEAVPRCILRGKIAPGKSSFSFTCFFFF